MCRPLGLFLTHRQCVVETGQMSSAETGQMSAVETGQMSAAETAADICPVSTEDIYPVSTEDGTAGGAALSHQLELDRGRPAQTGAVPGYGEQRHPASRSRLV